MGTQTQQKSKGKGREAVLRRQFQELGWHNGGFFFFES